MYSLNRNNRYEIIRELISKVDSNTIKELIISSGFYEHVKNYGFDIDQNSDDIEHRRLELLSYLNEMEKLWSETYIDMTDRQYIRVLK